MPKKNDGYFLTIPGSVYDDDNLSDAEKLFFALVSGLTVERGYCYASDEYLSRRTGKNPRSVRRIISALEEAGHLKTETKPKTDGAGGRERRIYLTLSYGVNGQGVKDTGKVSNLHLRDAEAHSAGGYRTPGEGTGQKCPEPSGGSGQKCPGVQDKNVRSYIGKNKKEEYLTTQNSRSITTVEAGLDELEDATTREDGRKEWEGKRFWSDRDDEKHRNAILDFLSLYDVPDPINCSWAWKRAVGFQPSPFLKQSLYTRAFRPDLSKEEVRERWDKLIAAVAVAANAGLNGSPGSIEYVLKSWKENPPGGKKVAPEKRVPIRFYRQDELDVFKGWGAIPADFVAWRAGNGAFVYALSEGVRPFVVNKLIDLDLPTIRVSDWPDGLELIYPSTEKEEEAA